MNARFRVTYHRAADLAADSTNQFVHGGLLLKVEVPPELALYDEVSVQIVAGDKVVDLTATVVQLIAGAGVAVTFAEDHQLTQLVATARLNVDMPVEYANLDDKAPASVLTPYQRVKNATTAEKMQLARKGGKEERALLIRDRNKGLHKHVLLNPHIRSDEVLAIAKMTDIDAGLLKTIADRREWVGRNEIALALVRNPKTPVGIAVKLLDKLNVNDIRQIARTLSTRQAVLQAARRKIGMKS